MTTSTKTEIIQLSNISGTEQLPINLDLTNDKERFDVLKKEMETFNKFHSNPILNDKYEVVNASMEILVLNELGITEYEFEIVPTDKFRESEIYFSSLLDNRKLTNLRKAEAIQMRVNILKELGVKNTTKFISDEKGISAKTIQNSKNIDKIEPSLKETLNNSNSNIGIEQLKKTKKLSPEQQRKVNKKVKKIIEDEKQVLNNKSYNETLNKVDNKPKKTTPNNIYNKTNRMLANCISEINKAKLTKNEDILMEQLKLISNKYLELKSQKENIENTNKSTNLTFPNTKLVA